MKQIKTQARPCNDEALHPMVGWSLDDDHKLSFSRDGDGDGAVWICYLGSADGEDLYCEVDLERIAEFGRMLVWMADDAEEEEASRLAEARANVDARRRSLWMQR